MSSLLSHQLHRIAGSKTLPGSPTFSRFRWNTPGPRLPPRSVRGMLIHPRRREQPREGYSIPITGTSPSRIRRQQARPGPPATIPRNIRGRASETPPSFIPRPTPHASATLTQILELALTTPRPSQRTTSRVPGARASGSHALPEQRGRSRLPGSR